MTKTLRSIINEEGQHDLSFIEDTIVQQDKEKVLNMHIPKYVTYPNAPCEVTSQLQRAMQEHDNTDWSWIWKLKIPQKTYRISLNYTP